MAKEGTHEESIAGIDDKWQITLVLAAVLSKTHTRNGLVVFVIFLPSLEVDEILASTPKKLHVSLKIDASVLLSGRL